MSETLPPIDVLEAMRDGVPLCRHCLDPVWLHPLQRAWLHEITHFRACFATQPGSPVAEPLDPDHFGIKRTPDDGERVAAVTYGRCMSG